MRGPQNTGVRCAIGALVAWTLVAGCGAQDAESEPFAGTILYEDKTGAFALRLLEPPWLPPIVTGGETIFVVPPSDATVTADLSVVLDQALYTLVVGVVLAPGAGDPSDAAQHLTVSLPAAAMTEQTSVRTKTGATGVQITWQETQEGVVLYHRDAFVQGPSTSTYGLAFTAKRPFADDAMVGQMIISFVPYL
jgi:hypothetical protein